MMPPTRKPLTAVTGALAVIVVLLVTQMWLLTATLEAYLGDDAGAALPGAILSGGLLAGVGAMYVLILRLDARARRAGEGRGGRR